VRRFLELLIGRPAEYALQLCFSMKKHLLIVSVLVLAACGKTSNSKNAAETPSTTPAPSPTTQQTPEYVLNQDQLNGIGDALGSLIFELIKGFQDLDGSFNFNPVDHTASFSQAYSCPISGTAALSGQAQVDVTLGYPSITASLLSASGTATFAQCKLALPNGEILTLDGSISLAGLSGALQGTLSLNPLGANASVNNTSNWNGTLRVAVGKFDKSCSVGVSAVSNGNVSVNSSAYVTGNFSGQVSGLVCGQNLSRSLNLSLY
jgi:hypothetical protein